MLSKDFSTDRYTAILANLRDNEYLTQEDVDLLIQDLLEQSAIVLNSVSKDKAEIVRRALSENHNRIKFN